MKFIKEKHSSQKEEAAKQLRDGYTDKLYFDAWLGKWFVIKGMKINEDKKVRILQPGHANQAPISS